MEDLLSLGDKATHIPRETFIITTSTLLAVAVLCTAVRIIIKILHGRAFHLDDYILFFGVACLIVGAGLIYDVANDLYISMDTVDPAKIERLGMDRFIAIATRVTRHIDAFTALVWTGIFCVKFSFLAFFRQFIVVPGSKTNVFYWVVVAVTAASWVFLAFNPFMACPHVDVDVILKCGLDKEPLFKAMTYAATAADCLTDALIVSIPVILLRQVRATLYQKLAMGTFMSLSIIMIVIAIIRGAIFYNPQGKTRDGPLQSYLVFIEGCIAVIMVSLTAFRTLFNLKREEDRSRMHRLQSPGRSPGESKEKIPTLESGSDAILEDESKVVASAQRAGLKTVVTRGTERWSRGPRSGELRRQGSVLRTREVVVSVSYDEDIEKAEYPWVTTPTWLQTTFEQNRLEGSRSGRTSESER